MVHNSGASFSVSIVALVTDYVPFWYAIPFHAAVTGWLSVHFPGQARRQAPYKHQSGRTCLWSGKQRVWTSYSSVHDCRILQVGWQKCKIILSSVPSSLIVYHSRWLCSVGPYNCPNKLKGFCDRLRPSNPVLCCRYWTTSLMLKKMWWMRRDNR